MSINFTKEYFLMSFLLLAFVTVVFIGSVNTTNSRQVVVTLDAKELINDFLISATAKESNSDKDKLAQKFGNCLRTTVDELSQKKNYLVLPVNAVIAGSRDITREIKHRMQKDCNNV